MHPTMKDAEEVIALRSYVAELQDGFETSVDRRIALEARVEKLERIPEWMTDYHDIHGHFPTANQIRDQFNIHP